MTTGKQAILVLAVVTSGCGACAEGEEVPGDPTRFDPVAAYEDMARRAGSGAELVQLSAHGVRSDGTVDLEQDTFRATVDYYFERTAAKPDDAPPVGAGGAEHWHQRIQIELRRAGHAGEETDEHGTRQVTTKGLRQIVSGPESGPVRDAVLPPPRCSFADLWEHASARGAPSGAVATIRYIGDGYELSIAGTDVSVRFSVDCVPAED